MKKAITPAMEKRHRRRPLQLQGNALVLVYQERGFLIAVAPMAQQPQHDTGDPLTTRESKLVLMPCGNKSILCAVCLCAVIKNAIPLALIPAL
jgi:hypothetical protein